MVQMSMEDKYEKENTTGVPKRIKLVFEIGLAVDETQFSKPTITKNEIGRGKTSAFYIVII